MNSADHVGTVAKTGAVVGLGLVVGLVVGLGLGLGLVVGLGLGSGLTVGVGLWWRLYPRLPALAGATKAVNRSADNATMRPIRR